jgi:hypothetical protein
MGYKFLPASSKFPQHKLKTFGGINIERIWIIYYECAINNLFKPGISQIYSTAFSI